MLRKFENDDYLSRSSEINLMNLNNIWYNNFLFLLWLQKLF